MCPRHAYPGWSPFRIVNPIVIATVMLPRQMTMKRANVRPLIAVVRNESSTASRMSGVASAFSSRMTSSPSAPRSSLPCPNHHGRVPNATPSAAPSATPRTTRSPSGRRFIAARASLALAVAKQRRQLVLPELGPRVRAVAVGLVARRDEHEAAPLHARQELLGKAQLGWVDEVVRRVHPHERRRDLLESWLGVVVV